MSERETALSRSQIATLRELADDLSQIVVAVSSRDGDATARQHQRAEAVRAVVEWLAGADPVPVCQWRETQADLYFGTVRPGCREGGSLAAEDVANFKACPYCTLPLALVPAEQTNKE